MKLNVKATGLNEVMRNFSMAGIKSQGVADRVTETYTRKMANEAGQDAPVRDNILRPDIISSPRRLKLGTWEFGSSLPYARRQEYEHATNRGFIRKSVWNNRVGYREKLRDEIAKEVGR